MRAVNDSNHARKGASRNRARRFDRPAALAVFLSDGEKSESDVNDSLLV
jgi:hypothetical protein